MGQREPPIPDMVATMMEGLPESPEERGEQFLESKGVSTEISPGEMHPNFHRPSYFRGGRLALLDTKLALAAARRKKWKREPPQKILDFPCGHGRVLRWLKAEFPEADLAACDIDRGAVDFCATVLGATPYYSHEELSQVDIEGSFDLIMCISLLTHHDAPRWIEFLRLCESLLSPDGVLFFTTHGRAVAKAVREGPITYSLDEGGREKLLQAYERDGFGYADYPSDRNWSPMIETYGISLSSPSWVCEQLEQFPSLSLQLLHEADTPTQHDLISCLRLDEPLPRVP